MFASIRPHCLANLSTCFEKSPSCTVFSPHCLKCSKTLCIHTPLSPWSTGSWEHLESFLLTQEPWEVISIDWVTSSWLVHHEPILPCRTFSATLPATSPVCVVSPSSAGWGCETMLVWTAVRVLREVSVRWVGAPTVRPCDGHYGLYIRRTPLQRCVRQRRLPHA